jgi:hypothetical protein
MGDTNKAGSRPALSLIAQVSGNSSVQQPASSTAETPRGSDTERQAQASDKLSTTIGARRAAPGVKGRSKSARTMMPAQESAQPQISASSASPSILPGLSSRVPPLPLTPPPADAPPPPPPPQDLPPAPPSPFDSAIPSLPGVPNSSSAQGTPRQSSRPPLSARHSPPTSTDAITSRNASEVTVTAKPLSDAEVAAMIEQMADDVVAAECEQMSATKTARDKAGMVGKENLHRNRKPVYAPVRQFLVAELKATDAFIAEVKKQGKLLERDYGTNPDALRATSGDAKTEGQKNVVDRSLLDPYNKPIFRIVCGERFDYCDSGLSRRTKMLLEGIDAKLHGKLLEDKTLSLQDIEKIRANLFKAILFTRGISVFLLNPNDDGSDTENRVPPRLFQNWSSAANRSFNIDYKDFARSFVSHGNTQLPEEAKKLYDAKQGVVREKRTRELGEKGKRSKNLRTRSQLSLLHGKDLQLALELGRQRELSSQRSGEPDDATQETIAYYRALYAGTKNWSPRQVAQFEAFYDERVAAWKADKGSDDDIEALERELKAIFRAFKQSLAKGESDAQSSSTTSIASTASTTSSTSTTSTASTASTRSATGSQLTDASSTAAPLSPRERYGIANATKRERERSVAFGKALKEFLGEPECAGDFADEDFRQDFEKAAWNAFDPEWGARELSTRLREIFEDAVLAHFKRSVVTFTHSGAVQESHPKFRQLDAWVTAWKAQHVKRKLLSGEVLSSIWMRIERDVVQLTTFKAMLSETDKAAIARFTSFDAAYGLWRSTPANLGKPLTDAVMQTLWQKASPQKSDPRTESGGTAPQSPLSEEAMKKAAQERARSRMREQLKAFIEDAGNPDFARAGFERAFLDAAIDRQRQSGMSALQPDKLKLLYTETQIQRFWTGKQADGWPDAARDHLSRLLHAQCRGGGNHVAREAELGKSWQQAMLQAQGAMLDAFLQNRTSWKAMTPEAQPVFRQAMADVIVNWIRGGAPGTVEKLFNSVYQDRLIEHFIEARHAEGKAQQSGLLRMRAADWRKTHADELLELEDLERIWKGLPDLSVLDELAQYPQ